MNVLFEKFSLVAANDIPVIKIICTLVISFILGLFVAFVYKRTHKGFSYAASFVFTLIMITVIVSVIMMVIGSNIALSLGLLGSLSIIRFRTVIKDTKDMAYLFWSIAEGLAVGAGNYLTAFIFVFFIGIAIIILTKVNFGKAVSSDYVMVVHINPDSESINEKGVGKLLDKNRIKWNIRSSLIDKESLIKEITYTLSSKFRRYAYEDLFSELNNIKDIKRISFLSPETNLFI